MTKFIMVRYDNKKYPQDITCEIDEIPGHFGRKSINPKNRYSLHTEYSSGKRKFDNELLKGLNEIKLSNKNGTPQLWTSKKWAKEFFKFIERLLCNSIDPEIIEIHPPFITYCSTIDDFLDIYETFEKLILNEYNNVKIFIENRNGKKFLISNCNDIINLCNKLSERKLKLKIVLDYPQLINRERDNANNNSIKNIIDFNTYLKNHIKYIGGIHLWGKKNSGSHNGNLNDLFNNNYRTKKLFLQSLYNTFDDNTIRYMVLEVNSNTKDLHDIIKDLIKYNFKFV